jgi:glycogen operon protein
VELMPVHQFLTTYWGYDTIDFFALHVAYSAARRAGAPGSEMDEFKRTVKTLHGAGIEVILDVVYNHTAEGDQRGGTICFRGFDNAAYYVLVPNELASYDNLTGCGNTINAGSPVVRRLILDSLRYWVQEFHVDGFRFDLAAVLGSEQMGTTANADPIWLDNARFFELLAQDPLLARVKLIDEPWTHAGDEQGRFPDEWSEWNGEFRNVVRDFWRDWLPVPRWAGARLAGSPDMYANLAPRYGLRRQPTATVSYITCHDGYTLADLVSYNPRRRPDGSRDDDRSWNCGTSDADGPSADPAINMLRRRQQRNFLACLMVARGVPMILAGDERNRSQGGDNNAYLDDNPTGWVDWNATPEATNLTTVVSALTGLRTQVPALRADRFPDPGTPDETEPVTGTGLQSFNPKGTPTGPYDWDNPDGHSFTVVFAGAAGKPSAVVALNAIGNQVDFQLPPAPAGTWTLRLDTTSEDGTPVPGALDATGHFRLGPRSLVIATS